MQYACMLIRSTHLFTQYIKKSQNDIQLDTLRTYCYRKKKTEKKSNISL